MAWELKGLRQWSVSGTTALPLVFNNLDGAEDIIVGVEALTTSASVSLSVEVSTNNGTSFYNTSGDYVLMGDSGTPTNAANFAIGTSSTTSARSSFTTLFGTNTDNAPKWDWIIDSSYRRMFVASLDPINAVRLVSSAAANMTAGKVYCMARMS